jgi:regulatory protein
MIITRIEEIERSKFNIYIDEDYAFLLYQKDIDTYGLQEGSEISRLCYEKIMEDTVLRRVKQKALAILKFMDRSEQELRKKLSDAGYSEKVVDQAIVYVKEYKYLDDDRFAMSYVRSRKNSKSKLAIKTELIQKGISKETIDAVFMEEYENNEQEDAELSAIQKAIAKKTKTPESLSYEEKQKLIASLYRKGFDLSKIKKELS